MRQIFVPGYPEYPIIQRLINRLESRMGFFNDNDSPLSRSTRFSSLLLFSQLHIFGPIVVGKRGHHKKNSEELIRYKRVYRGIEKNIWPNLHCIFEDKRINYKHIHKHIHTHIYALLKSYKISILFIIIRIKYTNTNCRLKDRIRI